MRVRLPDACWRQLKQRAFLRNCAPGNYADMALRYRLHEREPVVPALGMDALSEDIYVEVQVASSTRQRLVERSERERWNLATFSGLLLNSFVEKYERDPRDLGMIHYLASRLDESGVLSEQDLREGIAQCERNPDLRLPPGYFTRWLHARLRTMASTFHREGAIIPISEQAVSHLLD